MQEYHDTELANPRHQVSSPERRRGNLLGALHELQMARSEGNRLPIAQVPSLHEQRFELESSTEHLVGRMESASQGLYELSLGLHLPESCLPPNPEAHISGLMNASEKHTRDWDRLIKRATR